MRQYCACVVCISVSHFGRSVHQIVSQYLRNSKPLKILPIHRQHLSIKNVLDLLTFVRMISKNSAVHRPLD